MATHNPQFISIESLSDAKKEIKKIGSDPKSLDIMAPKAVFKVIKLEQVVLQDAIIIKQDMLSLGGEVADPTRSIPAREKSCSYFNHGDGDPTPRVSGEAAPSLPTNPGTRC